MKADIKAQWVKDLRSGQFEQGNGVLERVDGEGNHTLCCLGVLCRQAVKAGVIPAPELHNRVYRYLTDKHSKPGEESFNEECRLPRKVAEWAGLKHEDGTPREDVIIEPEDEGGLSAIGANDAGGYSFPEIADLIEQHVPVTE